MDEEVLAKVRRLLEEVGKEYRLERAILFGSRARGDQRGMIGLVQDAVREGISLFEAHRGTFRICSDVESVVKN